MKSLLAEVTNLTGHHYLTKLLLPTLISTAKTSSDGKARVVTVSSSAHVMGSLNFGTFKDTPARKNISTRTLYAQSKYVRMMHRAQTLNDKVTSGQRRFRAGT
jgi:NAD(P)-dependent dehydrogenase (short-subunit alcohol dehydrogenase family)